MPRADGKKPTAEGLMDCADRLVRARGFNAFSYRDLARTCGIRTASIHYHYPTKQDLGVALMARYLEQLEQLLARIDGEVESDRQKLEALIDFYRNQEERGAACLCGSFASDVETLPEELGKLVGAYLSRSESWVREKISSGARKGEFSPSLDPSDLAAALVAGLQGALLVGRAAEGHKLVEPVRRGFFGALGAGI